MYVCTIKLTLSNSQHTHTHTHTHTDPLQSVSIMGHLWSYYCSSLSQPSTPGYVLPTYHSTLEKLPWSLFFPDLASMDSMMKLRLVDNVTSFAFLGQIFPLFDWKTIAAAYRLASVWKLDDLYQVHILPYCTQLGNPRSTSTVSSHMYHYVVCKG